MSAAIRTVATAALAALCFSAAANAATPSSFTPCVRGFDVPITIYNRSRMTASELDAIVETARSLWRPYGVTLAPVQERGVTVILSYGSPEPAGSAPGRLILGTTMFTDGHAIPYIHLWVSAAESLLYATASTHVWNMPTIERDERLLPILGVALAHEIAHFLLDSSGHTGGGMLQRVIPVRDLQHPTPERLGLNVDQQFALCAAKDTQVFAKR